MPSLERKVLWQMAIALFIQERLQAKLDKLTDDDPKREELLAQHQHARRVSQIQAVTHSLKPIHPDARGTNLYVEPGSLPVLDELGSHALGQSFASDVVGNAAALDVYKFLKIEVGGISLLAALLAEDEAAMQALHDDPEQAKAWRDALVGLMQPRAGGSSSRRARRRSAPCAVARARPSRPHRAPRAQGARRGVSRLSRSRRTKDGRHQAAEHQPIE